MKEGVNEMKKRGLYISIILCMLIGLLSGCGNTSATGKNNGKKDEKVVLTVTTSAKELGDPEIFERFMEENPDIIVKTMDGGGLSSTKIIAAITSGQSIDIIRLQGYDELPVMVQRGMLAPLDDLEEKYSFDLDDCYDVINVCRFDGQTRGQGSLYALPKDWSPVGLWINKKVFEEAGVPLPSTTEPMTWDEFATLAKKLTVMEDGSVKRHGCVTALSMPTLLEMYLNSHGSTLWTDDLSSTTLQTADTKAAVEYFMDLHKTAALASSLYPSSDSIGGSALPAKTTAMAMAGYWFRGQWAATNYIGNVEGDMMFVPAPVGTKKASYAPDLTCLGVFSGSEHPEEAKRLLAYLTASEHSITARSSIGYGLPLFKSYFDTLPKTSEFDKQIMDVVTNYQMNTFDVSMSVSPYINYSSLTTLFDKYYLPVLYGRGSLEDGLKTINKEVELLVEEGKELTGE